ncbi:MAG: hypothetical protein ACXAD7_08365 [Candidatus Kariarchaeaceae archaeon]
MPQRKSDRSEKRRQERLKESIGMAIKSKEFTSTELLKQADDLISFSINLSQKKS